MLLIIFLAEYLHLIIASVHFVLFFIGGWYTLEYLFFLPPIFLSAHDTFYWVELCNNLIGV
jgi:NADH:ubiquinone oxidoreductase subunit H